jgi:signal transduction histidine kinase
MRAFHNHSIRRKLVVLFTATALLTVLIACTILWVYQLVDYRATLRTEESAMAQLVAESSAPALLFNDGLAANENLALLRADPRIEAACLYNKTGKVIAHFTATDKIYTCPPAGSTELRFSRRHLLIIRPISSQGVPVGSLYLNVSLDEMYRLLLRFAETVACVLLLSSLFALVLSSFLQGIISGPILALTRVAIQVSDQGNYLLRARRFSDDETGVLIDQFNAMMDRIQQREVDLQQAHTSLEDKVKERTLDLRNEIAERKLIERDLGTAKLAAEESNRAKSAFLATMSHELRTPLNAIIGYSEMLHEDAQAAGQQIMTGDLDKVLFSARHLLALISDILDLSRIEAGELGVFPEPVSTLSLLAEVLPTAEILVRRNGNVLQQGEHPWDGMLMVDPTRFRQCLLNLISNSCKFTESGRISIDVKQKSQDGQQWVLWVVRDTGTGISPAGLLRLFKTFSQVDSSTTRKHGGSGLGLAISQQLCQAMGGHISVESALGVGSTFTIHIPAYLG